MKIFNTNKRINTTENSLMNNLQLWVLCICLMLLPSNFAQQSINDSLTQVHQEVVGEHDDEHKKEESHDDHDEEDNDDAVEISKAQQQFADIVVEPLQLRSLSAEISAPGEVKLNTYLTRKVAPRITAQIMQRHVQLGEHVETGQPLVTLSSIEMAEAQGALQVTNREWQRVKLLGKSTVSERRFTEAQIAQQQALSRARAYGMTKGQINALLTGSKNSVDGKLQLLSPQSGTVTRDDFFEGEYVEPGRELFEISDESKIWVHANLTPEEARLVKTNGQARVQVNDVWLEGRVILAHHVLDETTRTQAVRIEVDNPDEQLHPGLFVETRISISTLDEVIAVPEDAVLRSSDGDWVIFIETAPGKFKAMEVDVIRSINGLVVIEGVKTNTRVVIAGAFFVQSEIAKSGFDIHNH